MPIRGKVIPFDRRSINEYYSLLTSYVDGYSNYISNHLDLQEVVATICRLGTEWKVVDVKTFTTRKCTSHFAESDLYTPEVELSRN